MWTWKEQISSFEKLDISAARALYIQYINCYDESLKKEYFDKIILGTLYVVVNYVENSNLEIFDCGSYDIDDIMNACLETWIKHIKEGELLKVQFYSQIFNKEFLRKTYNNTSSDNCFFIK